MSNNYIVLTERKKVFFALLLELFIAVITRSEDCVMFFLPVTNR